MKCDNCKQRPATVHLINVVNNDKSEAHLCDECARQRKGDFGLFSEPAFSFPNLLANLFELEQPVLPSPSVPRPKIRCDNCGLSYDDFRHLGQLGCSSCYTSFDRQLEPILKKIHGNTIHTGKVPVRAGGTARFRQDIERLRKELATAVGSEEYERAAQLRDEIRRLEEQVSGQGGE